MDRTSRLYYTLVLGCACLYPVGFGCRPVGQPSSSGEMAAGAAAEFSPEPGRFTPWMPSEIRAVGHQGESSPYSAAGQTGPSISPLPPVTQKIRVKRLPPTQAVVTWSEAGASQEGASESILSSSGSAIHSNRRNRSPWVTPESDLRLASRVESTWDLMAWARVWRQQGPTVLKPAFPGNPCGLPTVISGNRGAFDHCGCGTVR